MSIEIEGMAELRQRLQALGDKAKRVENKAIKAGGEIVATHMRENVNVSSKDQVHIRNDIVVSGIKKTGGETHVTVGPGKATAWRARFLEFGTVKMRPYPFIDPAAQQSKHEVTEAIKNVIKSELGL
jgi:HK97 gp10 family phage protein